MAYAIAAMAWDAADGTGDASCRDRSRAALQMVDADIMALMTKCTLYTFATKYCNIMLRHVYLRRALLRGPFIAKVRTQHQMSHLMLT